MILNEDAIFSKSCKNPVYIVLMNGKSPLASIILKATGDYFSHACIAFNDDLNPLYSFGAKSKTMQKGGMGFCISKPTDLSVFNKQAYYAVYVTYVTDEAYAKMKERLSYFTTNANKMIYDYVGLLNVWMHQSSDNRTRAYFCSRFVMDVIGAGVKLDKLPSLYRPQDIANMNNISLVNRGFDFHNYDKKITQKNEKLLKQGKLNPDDIIFEDVSSVIQKDFKSKHDMNLSQFEKMRLSDAAIQVYKQKLPSLSHVRINNNTKGYIWIDKKTDMPAAIVNVEEKDDGFTWIQAFEIFVPYKGHGLSKDILNVAIRELKATNLSVNKDNQVAIKIYKSYGFKIYKTTESMYFMSIDKNAFDDDNDDIYDESTIIESVSPKIYFLSESNMDGKTLSPRIPSNYMTKNGYEESKTPRVCFSTSIDGSLMGLSQNLKGKELYVHIPDSEVNVYKPSIKQVPDCKLTGEVWIKDKVNTKCIGKIKIIKDKGLPGHKYMYGNGMSAELYDWDWKWEDKYSVHESTILETGLPFKLYHGSRYLFDELRPFGIDFGNSFQDPGWSLFTWTKHASAMGWGCWEVFRHLSKIDDKIVLNGCLNSQTTVIWQSVYNYLKENIHKYSEKDLSFYVYTIPTRSEYNYGLGHSSNTPNCITIRTDHIKYSEVNKYVLTIDLVDKYCKIVPDGYKPNDKEYGLNKRLTSFFMKYDYMYQPEVKKIINKAIKNGEISPGDDISAFLKDNNIDLKTVNFKERLDDIISHESAIMESYNSQYKYSKLSSQKEISDFKNSMKIVFNSNDKPTDKLIKSMKKIEDNDTVIGYIGFSSYKIDGKKYLGIGNFMVLPQYQSKGYGANIITDVINMNKDKYDEIYCYVEESNTRAISFYKRVGKVGHLTDYGYYVTLYSSKSHINESTIEDFEIEAETGFYDKHNRWNPIVIINGEQYRHRVECLIMRQNKLFVAKSNTGALLIPGGGVDKSLSDEEQVYNECKEEARIIVENIKPTGYAYVRRTGVSESAKRLPKEQQWVGSYTEIYIADYAKDFTGFIDYCDRDSEMIRGDFRPISEIVDKLVPEWKQALIDANYISVATEALKSYKDPKLALKRRMGIKRNNAVKLGDFSNVAKSAPVPQAQTISVPSPAVSSSAPSSAKPAQTEETEEIPETVKANANRLLCKEIAAYPKFSGYYYNMDYPLYNGNGHAIVGWKMTGVHYNDFDSFNRHRDRLYEYCSKIFEDTNPGYGLKMDKKTNCIYITEI